MSIRIIVSFVIIFGTSLFTFQGAHAQESLSIKVINVPERLVFPLDNGTNYILTAIIKGGIAHSVWMAPSRESTGRLMLTKADDHEYQINLADPMVASLLSASEAKQFYIFVETIDHQVMASLPIHFSLHPSKLVPLGTVTIYVRQGQKREDLFERWYWQEPWYNPEEVDAFEIEFRPRDAELSATAVVDEKQWAFVEDARHSGLLRLEMTDDIRQAWRNTQQLSIFCEHPCETLDKRIIHAIIPEETLTLQAIPEPLTIIQRRSASLPGSNDYLVVTLGDITAGQVLLTLTTRDRRELVPQHSMRQGEYIDFEYGGTTYRLALVSLINFLIGDDYAVFLFSPQVLTEVQKIAFLLKALRYRPVTLVWNDQAYSGGKAESHLRREFAIMENRFNTMEDFLTEIASHSIEADQGYRVKQGDGTTFEAAQWFRDIATTFFSDVQ